MSVKRGTAITVTFPAVDPQNRPERKSGITFPAGAAQISKDGGAFANTTNVPTEISLGRYELELTAVEMNAAWVHVAITDEATDPVDLMLGTSGNPSGVIVADGSNTSSTFKTDLAESVNDYWKDALILFTTGNLAGQVKKVSAFNATTDFITVSAAFTGTPANGDRFLIVNI